MKRSFIKGEVSIISALLTMALIITHIGVCAAVVPYANVVQISDTEYRLTGVADISNTNIATMTVYNPEYDASDLEKNSPAQNLAALAYFDDFECEADGSFDYTFKLNPNSEGDYTVCLGGAGTGIEPISVTYDAETAEPSSSVNLTFDGVTNPNDVIVWSGGNASYTIENEMLSINIPNNDKSIYSQFDKELSTAVSSGVYKLAFDYKPMDLNYNTYLKTIDSKGNESVLFILNDSGRMGIIPATEGYDIYNKHSYTSGSVVNTELYIDFDARRLYYVTQMAFRYSYGKVQTESL